MGNADASFERYGRKHRNPTNKAVHCICIYVRSFLVGPAWLLGFVYRRLGIAY